MNPTKLKILHVLSQRPDSTGSGIFLQAMLREASKIGHTNFMVAAIQSSDVPQLAGIDADHCRYVVFGGKDLPYPIAGMSDVMPYANTRFRDLSQDDLADYEAAFRHHLETVVAGFQPDIVHSHHLWILTSLIRRLWPQIPLVATCHGTDLRQFQNCPHLRQRVLAGCRDLDGAMALSSQQKKEIEQLYGLPRQRVHVVGAGYDEDRFFQAVKPKPAPVRIVYAGKLCRAKGVPWMLRALSTIASPEWHLDLVGGGSGEEHAQCIRMAQEMGARVHVHGAVNQRRLAEIMAHSHVFILSSLFEGLPLVVLEALASGCRVVATDLPGVRAVLAGVQADYIERVKMPRLVGLDQPVAADEQRFELDMAHAVQRQLQRAIDQPDIDLTALAEMMAAATWSGIFERVQRIYKLVLK
jgi:glycosyltransferase involved in cell wall biosynthesis